MAYSRFCPEQKCFGEAQANKSAERADDLLLDDMHTLQPDYLNERFSPRGNLTYRAPLPQWSAKLVLQCFLECAKQVTNCSQEIFLGCTLDVTPVLNWANVCSSNILRTLRRTMIRFLTELLVRRIWFGQSKLYFILNWLVMRCKLRPELAADAQQTA